jgi:hypothetical protein
MSSYMNWYIFTIIKTPREEAGAAQSRTVQTAE